MGFLDPKSPKAYRTVGLPAPVVERLRTHRREQIERRVALGAWQELDLVVDRGDGGPLDPDSITKAFRRFSAKAGLDPKTTLHDLRHAALTEMGKAGVHPVIVSALAGHSDPAFTMRVYQHAWDEGAEQGAAAIDAVYNL